VKNISSYLYILDTFHLLQDGRKEFIMFNTKHKRKKPLAKEEPEWQTSHTLAFYQFHVDP